MSEALLEDYGTYDGQCVACDDYARINDAGLCQACAAKLERDLIRDRDRAYSVTAYAMSNDQRKDLYRQVVRRYGKAPSQETNRQKTLSVMRRRPWSTAI